MFAPAFWRVYQEYETNNRFAIVQYLHIAHMTKTKAGESGIELSHILKEIRQWNCLHSFFKYLNFSKSELLLCARNDLCSGMNTATHEK